MSLARQQSLNAMRASRRGALLVLASLLATTGFRQSEEWVGESNQVD
jgi:hypothetical protein